jgi:maleate cis-trans isomerase
MTSDSWGWRARIGILVIHKDAVPEAEIWAMAPPGVTVHSARFASPRTPGSDFQGDQAAALVESPDIARGLEQLGQLRLDVICLCFGSSSFIAGAGFDELFAEQARARAGGTPVTTAPLAMLDALRCLGIRRPHLVSPPWFTATSYAAAERYFAESGLPFAGQMRFDLGAGWRDRQTYEIYDLGGQWEVRPEEVYRQARASLPAHADGILIPGSGFRTLEAIEPLERDLGVPVVTSNQACLWQCLRMAGVRDTGDGTGRLFDHRELPEARETALSGKAS